MKDRETPRGLVVITGPTASGKGELAFELALRLGGELISLDSMKVYRELDVGTAKPQPERRERIRYHLLDILDPHESFSTGEYLPRLAAAIAQVVARGSRPILVGGTALYLKGFLDGFQAGTVASLEVRNRLEAEAQEVGPEALHVRLQSRDPAAAGKIHRRDVRRIVRALESHESTGRPLSEEWAWKTQVALPPGVRVLGLQWPKSELHARIHLRVERMVERGLFAEAERLRSRSPPLGPTSAQSIGYKEIWSGLDQGKSPGEIVERLKQRTRRFAKSQLTWFRKLPIEWLPVTGQLDISACADEVIRRLEREAP